MTEPERARLVANIAGHLSKASPEVQRRQLKHFTAADAEYGARIASALGIDVRTSVPT
jgi:catalase